MSQRDIERLMALEKDLREEERQLLAESRRHAAEGNDETAEAFCNGKAFGLNAASQRIATLIAELGQEVGAVPNGKLVGWWNGITPGFDGMGVPSIRWGADAENSGHDIPLYDGYNPIHYVTPPFSPAHTSEARDAARYQFLAGRAHQDKSYDIFGNGGHWSIGVHSNDNRLDLGQAIDAAMRQEGGSDE